MPGNPDPCGFGVPERHRETEARRVCGRRGRQRGQLGSLFPSPLPGFVPIARAGLANLPPPWPGPVGLRLLGRRRGDGCGASARGVIHPSICPSLAAPRSHLFPSRLLPGAGISSFACSGLGGIDRQAPLLPTRPPELSLPAGRAGGCAEPPPASVLTPEHTGMDVVQTGCSRPCSPWPTWTLGTARPPAFLPLFPPPPALPLLPELEAWAELIFLSPPGSTRAKNWSCHPRHGSPSFPAPVCPGAAGLWWHLEAHAGGGTPVHVPPAPVGLRSPQHPTAPQEQRLRMGCRAGSLGWRQGPPEPLGSGRFSPGTRGTPEQPWRLGSALPGAGVRPSQDHPGSLGARPGRGAPGRGHVPVPVPRSGGGQHPGLRVLLGLRVGAGPPDSPPALGPRSCTESPPLQVSHRLSLGLRGQTPVCQAGQVRKSCPPSLCPHLSTARWPFWVSPAQHSAGANPPLHPFGGFSVAQRRRPHLQCLAEARRCRRRCPSPGGRGARRAGAGAAGGPTFLLRLGFDSAARRCPDAPAAPRSQRSPRCLPRGAGWDSRPVPAENCPARYPGALRSGLGLWQLPGCWCPRPTTRTAALPPLAPRGRASPCHCPRRPQELLAERPVLPQPPGHACCLRVPSLSPWAGGPDGCWGPFSISLEPQGAERTWSCGCHIPGPGTPPGMPMSSPRAAPP